ncbi:MAG: thymidine kinase [Bacilli bacterium]|nr:thymidine kinase [Bacilli bacterium]
MAKLIFKYSTMNSGKTIDLIRTAHNYEENNCKVLVLKPIVDTKGNDKIVTRIGLERKVDILIKEDDSIINILKGKLEDIKCILIDESQFLKQNQIDELFIITKAMDIPVICYGLRNNFKLESFEGSRRLLEISDTLEEFKTLCFCGDVARYAGRKVNGEYAVEGEEIVIDGTTDVEYVPLCGKHYLENVTKINLDKIKEDLK